MTEIKFRLLLSECISVHPFFRISTSDARVPIEIAAGVPVTIQTNNPIDHLHMRSPRSNAERTAKFRSIYITGDEGRSSGATRNRTTLFQVRRRQ
jgi:hypothetical protein